MPTYTATWPGVSSLSNFSCAFGPGIRPSTFVLNTHISAVDLNTLGRRANLSVVRNEGGGPFPVLELTDCMLESPRITETNGTNISLPIKDRRWKWQFGSISGSYNVRQPSGLHLRPKTPQELAELCLLEMSEIVFDVASLPNDAVLPREWVAANPAQELDRICRELGCIVVLNPVLDSVEIWRIGESRNPNPMLDNSFRISGGSGTYSAAAPTFIDLYCGESLFQSAFKIGEPVGREVDGTILPIDQLSYAPNGGWSTEDPNLFSFQFDDSTYNDPETGEQRMVRDLAMGSIWKMYRIEELAPGGVSPDWLVGDPKEPDNLRDLNLKQFRLETYDALNGEEIRKPARVIGSRYVDSLNAESSDRFGELDVPFRISNEEGIIIFTDAVYRYNDRGDPVASELFLECAFTAGKDGLNHRYTSTRVFDLGLGGGVHPVVRRDMVFEQIERFDFTPELGAQRVGAEDNEILLIGDSQVVFDGEQIKFRTKDSQTMTKAGVHAVSPDGNIVQVSWSKSSGGTTTAISSGRQHNPYVPTIEDQRRIDALADLDRLKQLFDMP